MKNLILGVDPGLSGAMALVKMKTKPDLIDLWTMPLRADTKRNEIDLFLLSGLVSKYAKEINFAVIEEVGAMTYTDASGKKRGQGASASFAFGKSAGIVHGILAANQIPMYFVRPGIWKIQMGLSSNKDESRALAVRYFPASAERFKRKKDDGLAEASLLGVFGMRFAKQMPKSFEASEVDIFS